MVSSTKTLTVSYGTFSCTAAGFEDPLAVVKEAAAFFHGLVQEDSFFGSEPARLDGALIESFRRAGIDAEQTQDGLTLRPAAEDETVPDPAAEPPGDPEADLADISALDGLASHEAPQPASDENELAPPADELAAEEDWQDSMPVAPAEPAPHTDSIDARLDRIRALVRQPRMHAGPHPAAAEEQSPEAPSPVKPAAEEEDAPSASHDGPRDEPGSVTFTAAPEATATAPGIRTRILKIQRSDFEEALATGRFDASPVEQELEEEETLGEAHQPPGTLTPEEEAELARELEAVKAELADDWDDEGDREVNLGGSVTARPHDPEDHATNDLATTGADRPEDLAERLVRENVRKTVKLSNRGRAMLTEGSVDDGNNTSRLLDETNREMAEPEGNRRRSAIAHLRAAVAATRADRLLGRKPDEAKQAEPYREDLATVVRPRPHPPARNPLERPVVSAVWRAEGAPLKLVAEQQVAPPRTDSPLRPRNVSPAGIDSPVAPDTQSDTPDTGFPEYAEKVGARTLSERLEAAAAYISFVEGRDQFSRPQLMATLRLADTEDSSREDRLRSFGQLLREGKIEKTRGGRFTASDRIGFKPPQAAAG
ncbi:hypothetical protein [Allosediminivita pacifica]|nr:hypothetical protein [Allosediminivita pacifica]GGB04308.1 hypothetical protein GCM10011324_13140 [Allosediminivita pacifica]